MNKEMVEIFKQMLYADALRGWDSTGIACIKGNNDVKVIKDACSAGPFLFRNQDHTWAFQNRAFIGHNRWATKGATTAENAHPFTEGHITLAHNGTLRYHRHLKNVDVDSHAICHSMAEVGHTITLSKLDGAFALIWYNDQTKEIYATRNNERPLAIVETDQLYIIVSEKELAHWICARNNVKVTRTTICDPFALYTFKESKANKIYMDKSKYIGFKPEPYIPKQTETKALPSNVTQIRPLIENPVSDIKPGDKIEALFYTYKEMQYSSFNLGKRKWECDSLDSPNIIIEVFTDDKTNFSEMVVEITVDRVFYSPHLSTFTVIGRNPTIQKKAVADEKGPITSNNGLRITNEVLDKVKDCNCTFCAAPFTELEEEQFSQVVIHPVAKNGHVYKYTYYCPDCSDYFHMQKQKGISKSFLIKQTE